jgi:hypothetical protein
MPRRAIPVRKELDRRQNRRADCFAQNNGLIACTAEQIGATSHHIGSTGVCNYNGVTTRLACRAELGEQEVVMTETVDSTTTTESGPAGVLARDIPTEELAVELMERAQADGVRLVGPGGLLADLTKRVLEAGLNAEMTEHVGYEPHDPAGHHSGNSRNGCRSKTVLTDIGTARQAGRVCI